ncbi:Protein kinase domain/Protein tyrosine kinase, putative [Leishmania naiffi]|uniref:mitogen-activated protein kinase kinase n=1 Tax=Leishmania naiffi TaxID=5678 RepID=A0AAW3B9A0_9TRYP
MHENRRLSAPPDARHASSHGGSGRQDVLSSSTGALSSTVTFSYVAARAAHGSQDDRPSKDAASTTVAMPLMVGSRMMDAVVSPSDQRCWSPSVFDATPFSVCSASPRPTLAAQVAASIEVPSHPGAEEELQTLKPPVDATSLPISIIDTGCDTGAEEMSPSVSVGEHSFEAGRSALKRSKLEASFTGVASTASGFKAGAPASMSSASHSALSGWSHLHISSTRLGKVSDVGWTDPVSNARDRPLPANGMRNGPASWIAACASHRASSNTNEEGCFEGTKAAAGALGDVAPFVLHARSADHISSWLPPQSSRGTAQPLIRLPSKRRCGSHVPGQHHYTADSSFSRRQPSSYRRGAIATRPKRWTCRVPVSLAVVMSTVISVILVAVLTVVPFNTASVQSAEYVMSTLSLSLASSYTRAIEASMLFLPNAIRTYSFAYMSSSNTQSWNWTAADMPQAMRQMCRTVAGTKRNPTSFLLYMSLSSPYTGYSAYCSQQYDDYLIGNYIVDNSSQPRYLVNGTTYNYVEPPIAYPAVQSMTPWEYMVDFGGLENTWHKVVVPWYAEYQMTYQAGSAVESAAAYEAAPGRAGPFFPAPKSSLGGVLMYPNGYWRIFTTNNVSVITYTYPFVDYAGNPASIMGALKADGFNAVHPSGLITTSSTARVMVVDTLSGLVFITSWGQSTTVRLDNWKTPSNCTPDDGGRRAVYLEDIADPLMIAAVRSTGGRQGIYDISSEMDRWMGQFTLNGTENLVVISRVALSSNYSNMNLVVMYVVCKGEYVYYINQVQRTAIISVVLVLAVIVLLEIALLYLLVQPVRGVAAGLRAAAELRDGSECIDNVTSMIKEVAEMQHDFCIMNSKLMQMKKFLPQGMLGRQTVYSNTNDTSDTDLSALPTSAPHEPEGGGMWESVDGFDRYAEPEDGLDDDDGSSDAGAAQRGCKNNDDTLGGMRSVNQTGQQRRRWGCDQPVTSMTNFVLNDRVLLEEVNHFRRRYCSTIVFCMHLMESEMSVKFLNTNCIYFTEGVLPCVLRYGGVVELQRPDYIVVSFSAHNKVALHQNRAAMCALEVMHVLNTITPIGPRVGCMIDASEYYVGTCGAADRNALVTFSHSLVAKDDLIRVLKSVQTQIILTQRLASTLESSMLVMPVDCMVLNPIGKKVLILYELRGHVRMLPPKVSVVMVRQVIRAVRMGFTHMLKGDYVRGLEMLEPYEAMELQAARLGFMCRAFVAHHIHRPFVRSITRLTFSEANFAGYNESCFPKFGEPPASGTSLDARRSQSVADGSMEVANPLTTCGGAGGNTALFAFSPFSKDLDPTTLLTTPPTPRWVLGAALSPFSLNKEDSPKTNERGLADNAVSVATCANGGCTTEYKSSGAAKVESGQIELEGGAASCSSVDKGETALFEIFVEDQPDDDMVDGEIIVGRTGYYSPCDRSTISDCGTGALQTENRTSAAMGKTGTTRCHHKCGLPLFFSDYEGNAWRRSYDVLGTGAFSTVYRGLSMTGNLVALKCFRLGARNIEVNAIVDEVRLFANLHHENVVQYLSLYVSDAYVIEIMEFVPGGSLHTLLKSFGSLQPESVRRYLRDIARGLSYLHAANIVHCDIKPHNVLLAMDGQCKLSDFGSAIARATSSIGKIDDVIEMRGAPGYMAPEVARGDVSTMKSDVYSLGITILELLTGKLPWDYADAFAPRLSGKLTQSKSAAEHALQLQTCLEFPPGGTSVMDGVAAQVGASLSREEFNTGFGDTQAPLGVPMTDSRFSAVTMPSNSSRTGPASSIGTTVHSLDSGLLFTKNNNGEGVLDFGCSVFSTNNTDPAGGSPYPPPEVLTCTPGEGGSEAVTLLRATTASVPSCFHPSSANCASLANFAVVEDAAAETLNEGSIAMLLSDAQRRPLEVKQSRKQRQGIAVLLSSTSWRAPDMVLSSPSQHPCSAMSLQHRPIEQVLQSSAQLIVLIGRGVVVPHIPDTLDEDVIDFLELCLKPDPAERSSVSELMLHPWLM